jgi:hypothetical protein
MYTMLRYVGVFMLFVVTSHAQFNSQIKLPTERIRQSLDKLRSSTSNVPSAFPSYKKSSSLPFPSAPMSAVSKVFTKPNFQNAGNRRQNVISPSQVDTAFVGIVPNDTLVVTGNWTCNGPVFVFNDGVLIFNNANATILGDIFIWGNGSIIGDSTQFHIPQAWFYQRSVVAVDSATLNLNQCSFEFSGMSHNFIFQGEAEVNLNHIYQNDWTTAGLWGNPKVNINDCNLVGEYIVSGTSQLEVRNSDTLLLWQHYPDTAVINTTYPSGALVNNYVVNQSQQGINGIGYSILLDTCTNIWWGLMPVNGSDVTINNSIIRAIGCWFQNGDSVNVSGLVNNSIYTNFTAPLPDRILQFNNCNVQTWSLYVFDSSYLHITGCILGEVGTQYKSMCLAENFLMDGSGGYFWATDTSVIVSSLSSAMSIIRSEKNGIFVFGYGTCNSNPPTAIGQSVMIVVQSSMPQDPIAEEHGVVWYANLNGPASGFTNTVVPIIGTAFIDQGPLGSWMDFQAYSLYYKIVGDTIWTPIVIDSAFEIRHGLLASWNTLGISPGNYELKLTLINDLGDRVDAQKNILLQPGILGLGEVNTNGKEFRLYPNPAANILVVEPKLFNGAKYHVTITNISGQVMYDGSAVKDNLLELNVASFSSGNYQLLIKGENGWFVQSFNVMREE